MCACVCVFINMHKMLQLQGVYEQKKVGEEQSGRTDGKPFTLTLKEPPLKKK